MRIQVSRYLALSVLLAAAVRLSAQQTAKPEDTEVWEPVPKVVTPGPTCGAPPSDAVILFDGKNLDEWVSAKDHSPADWTVADGVMTVKKPRATSKPNGRFKDYQLHVEWRIPEDITGSRPGPRQQRRVPRLHRSRRRRLRIAGSGLLQQQDLRQRQGRQHLQAIHSAGESLPQARRVATSMTSSGPPPPSTPTDRSKRPPTSPCSSMACWFRITIN